MNYPDPEHLTLVPPDHPALHRPGDDVTDFGYARRLAIRMRQVIDEHDPKTMRPRGIGLSACQLGVPLRLIVLAKSFGPAYPDAICNPEILKLHGAQVRSDEGCLSLNVRCQVLRSTKVRWKFQAGGGAETTMESTGLAARVIQHEVDHTMGILITARA